MSNEISNRDNGLMINTKLLVVLGIICGLIIGIGSGYFLFPPDISIYENQISQLAFEITTLEETSSALNEEIKSLESQLSFYQSKYEEVSTLKSLQIDVDLLVENLMKPRAEHSWEEGYRNADIQAVIVTIKGTKYYDDLYLEIKEKMEEKGGAAVSVNRYAENSDYGPSMRSVAQFLEGDGDTRVAELIETYGVEHIAILHLGGTEIINGFIEVYQNPSYPIINEIPWVVPDPFMSSMQFNYILNPPW